MELHFIINPVAKNGYSIKIWSKIEKVLQKHQFSYHSYFTEGPGDAVRYVEKTLTNAAETVFLIAVGGDGTIHEVVNGAYSFKNGIVGYIPAGSEMIFPGISHPEKPEKSITVYFEWDSGETTGGDCRCRSICNEYGKRCLC